ncbi:hypothetical protein IWW34DRAFT_754662 [Fusarium oxysporum f. sp. albedinis]|nr:hypothetical protein IWW34DRAFT_754662 [Fusarium oxysporum f. sp. albedinis]
MPQQRLPFVKWSQRRESSISVDFSDYSGQHLHSPDESETPKSRPCTASTTSSIKPRTSWIFSHMPDEEIETRYYNERTGKEEWRCKHCDRTYACSGGTAAPANRTCESGSPQASVLGDLTKFAWVVDRGILFCQNSTTTMHLATCI